VQPAAAECPSSDPGSVPTHLSPTAQAGPVLAAAGCTLATIVAPLLGRWWLTALLTAVATAMTAWVAIRVRRHPVDARALLVAAVVLLGAAIVVPSLGSRDIWSYEMVGRTVAIHHANPFVLPAGTFATDPFLHRVGITYRHTTTPYGPVFVGYATVVAEVAGSHPVLARIGFQLGAALAVATILLLLWRATGATGAVVLVALHPVMTATIVNGGHNDAYVGLAILGSVLLARAERFAAAGWVLTLGALVKVTAGLALLPLAAWTWSRHGRRAALELCAPTLLFALPLTIAIPGALGSVVGADAHVITRASPWNAVAALGDTLTRWSVHMVASTLTRTALAVVFLVAVLAAVHAFRSRSARGGRPTVSGDVAAATSVWLFIGAYTLPWYAGWSLPVAALEPAAPLTGLIVLQAGFLGAVNAIPRHLLAHGTALGATVQFVVPLVVLAAFAVTLGRTWLPARAGTPLAPTARAPSAPGAGRPPLASSRYPG
jgi:hypothetical protein